MDSRYGFIDFGSHLILPSAALDRFIYHENLGKANKGNVLKQYDYVARKYYVPLLNDKLHENLPERCEIQYDFAVKSNGAYFILVMLSNWLEGALSGITQRDCEDLWDESNGMVSVLYPNGQSEVVRRPYDFEVTKSVKLATYFKSIGWNLVNETTIKKLHDELTQRFNAKERGLIWAFSNIMQDMLSKLNHKNVG